MNNKRKLLLLKVTASLMSILIVFTLIVSEISNNYEQGTVEYNKYATIGISCMAVGVILAIITFNLMGSVKLVFKNLHSEKLKIKSKTFKSFINKLTTELIANNYSKMNELPCTLNCEMKYFVRYNKNINDLIIIIREKELTTEVAKEYLEEALIKIVEKEPNVLMKNLNLIHIICVDKSNDELKKITEKHVEHGYGRFILPIGIVFEDSTVYIAPQKDGYFIGNYKKLVKMFKKYINIQLDNKND